MKRIPFVLTGLLPALVQPDESASFFFRDVTEETRLLPHVSGIRGHAAGWGDIDNDGWIDLYVGTFHAEGSKPNMLFHNTGGRFKLDDQENLRLSSRANAGLFADLDNDGDLDLYVASMPGMLEGRALAPCSLFRNDGGGRFTNVSEGNGACPASGFAGRSAAALDFDGDGLLDLLVGDCCFATYQGRKTSRLFRNQGNLQFEDASEPAGLPPGIPGLGVAAADVNNDTWPDIFIAARDGGNRLFLNDGAGNFREASCSPRAFDWGRLDGDNTSAGVAFGDVNRDGLLDMVIGQHFKSPWKEPVAVRLYRNHGIGKDGQPDFEDVTRPAGLPALAMKAPHVEIQDFDNDGWEDVYVSIVKYAQGRPSPIIFKGAGHRDGIPRFRDDAWGVNDFPTEEDRSIAATGEFFKKMIKDRKIVYTAPGPSGDFDNDGKLDLFLANWWLESPSLLLRNETPGGHWLNIALEGSKDVNRMGLGARIRIYKAGQLGQPPALIGCREMSVGFGYVSGQPAVAHFGLGKEESCDLEVEWPHRKGKTVRTGVKVDRLLTVER